ncbi:MAG: SDR family NAD(P)-dependent oxidoreductase [Alphaproteobacteria bacterium]|nr:SDR family NAD(P)-dependent oxidoreductase [Alphaproteobacteria bacterium]
MRVAGLNPAVADWRGRSIWLVGASSGIGQACAQALMAAGARVAVSARQATLLEQLCAGHDALPVPCDVTDLESVREAAERVRAHQGLDWVVYCAGHYKPIRPLENLNLPELLRHQAVNYNGVLHVLDAVLPALVEQGRGHISMVGSVAGYRGLPMSMAYGPTKAAMHHLAEILYMELKPAGIGVSVVNPGFVATPLTAQNQFHMPALLQPDEAARAMLHGWERGEFEIHFPKRFSRFLKCLRWLPDRWYFPLVWRATQGSLKKP